MELTRWNPMREMLTASRVLDNFFFPEARSAALDASSGWKPAVDIYREDDHLVISAEILGFDRNDIDVNVDGRVLTLKGERSTEKEVKKDQYYRKERRTGSFERRFTLPADINPEKIEANFKNGILEVRVPKAEEHKAKQITVH